MSGQNRASHYFSRAGICCALLLMSSLAAAEDYRDRDKEVLQPLKLKGNTPGQVAPDRRISNRQAASLVKQQYSSSRILGISVIEQNGPPLYRVRTLSPDGVVKSVFVDGESGEVFE